MDIRKEPGGVIQHSVSGDDLALINRLAKAELTAQHVYTFAVRLCDNEVDRDWERFDQEALEELGRLFEGKCGIFDHNWSAKEQTARLYKTEICQEAGVTLAGDACRFLKGYAYMLRNEKNSELIQEIEAGIKKEVSIGCSVTGRICSICGQIGCSHLGGREYGGKLCFFTLTQPTDAYEWSFVAVPAQRKSGVIKAFGEEGGLRRFLAGRPGYLRQLDALEKEARLGRTYLDGLRRELVRLAGLADEAMDLEVFRQVAEKLEEGELVELAKTYRRRLDAAYPVAPQLRPQESAPRDSGDSAFLV